MQNNNIEYLKKDYFKSNYFESKFGSSFKLVETKQVFDLTNIFLEKLKSLFNLSCSLEEICNLHHKLDENLKIYDQKFAINKISTFFYDMPDIFKKKYIELLKSQIRPVIGQDFYFQDNPTLRVQMPHITAEPMYPYFHSDIQLGHPPYEINVWMPLNPPSNSEGHGFSITSLKDSIDTFKKYNFDILKISENGGKDISNKLNSISKLQNFKYGNAVLFDTRCLHSTQVMKNHTRISVDVRITPTDLFHKFNHNYQGIGRKGVIYKPGDGYNIKSIDNLNS